MRLAPLPPSALPLQRGARADLVGHATAGANDGLVSVESAKWGDYRATLHNVNHLDLIGWVGKVRYSYAAWTGHEIKFRPVSFFSSMAEMLADEGL